MKRILAAAALAAAMLAPGALLAPAALAHSELISTDPADGAVLDAPPERVSFTFSEPLMPDFVRIIGTNPEGVTGDLPVSSVEGSTATVNWPAGAQGGTWQVRYRVVSQDGHPIEGGITFTYDGPTPSPTGALPTSAAPTSTAPTSAAPTSVTPTSAAPTSVTSPAADTSGGTSGLLIAGLAVGAIVIVGVVIALVARRRA